MARHPFTGWRAFVVPAGSVSLMRLRIDFAYDGTEFSGWAAQPGRRTVEGELTNAIETVARVSGLKLTVAGRTDAGVHARGGVCHVDLDDDVASTLPGRSTRTPAQALLTRLNGVLPGDIVCRGVDDVSGDFDARFSATKRRYSYRLLDQPERLDPLRRYDTVVVKRPLDVDAMNAAAGSLVGLNDFAAFCKKREGATTIRTLLNYSWHRDADGVVVGRIEADAFCHSMVRALVGAVVPVGEGRRPSDWPRQVMTAAVRDPGVVVMPAHGLCLEEVSYPEPHKWATRAEASRATRELPPQAD